MINLKEERQPIVEQCIGCQRIEKLILNGEETEIDVCQSYLFPEKKWRFSSGCPLATHKQNIIEDQKGKVRVGQQKQKKRK